MRGETREGDQAAEGGSAWHTGRGEMALRIRSHDWAATPLGPIERWPQSLKTAVGIMMNTRHPVFIFWGPEFICLYNDAYAESLGPEKHPSILGMPAPEAWPEAFPIVEPELRQVMAGGEATWQENNLVPIYRHGRIEEVYWTYSYGPIQDSHAPNGVGGVLTFITETTQAVVSRRESAEKYRTLFETMDEGFCFVEVLFDEAGRPHDYRFLETNPAFVRQTGLADAVGRTMLEVAPAHEPHWFEIYGRVALTGEPARFEAPAAALGRWFDVYAFRMAEPAARRVAILFTDITDRKHADAVLRASEARHRAIIESARDYAIFTADSEGRIVTWSPGAEAVFGWTAEEAAGRPLAMTFTPEDRAEGVPEAEREEALRNGSALDVRWHLCKDGSRVFIEGVMRLLEDGRGGAHGFVKVGQDVTERRRVEAALREGEERLRLFGEASSDVIWMRDAETMQFEYVSPAFESVYGLSRDRVLSGDDFRNWAELVVPEDRERAVANLNRVREGERATFEYRIRRPDGQVRWLRNTDFPVKDTTGRTRLVAGIGQDVTEIKQAEEALRELNDTLEQRVEERTAELERTNVLLLEEIAERRQVEQDRERLARQVIMAEQEERRRLSQILHDDLQQVLYGVQMKLSMAHENVQGAGHEKDAADIRKAQRWIEQAVQTTRQLTVDLSPPILKGEDLVHMIQWLRTLVEERFGLQVEIRSEPLVAVPDAGVRVLLFQIVRELLFNVAKHAGTDRASVVLRLDPDGIAIEVIDRGRGFDMEALSRGGRMRGGLGLASAQERLRILGGRMEMASRPGAGTRVTIYAPVQPPEQKPV